MNKGIIRKIAVLLLLLMTLTSVGVVFAGDDEEKKTGTETLQGVFQSAYGDEDVQNATVEITKPMAKFISIGFAAFGLLLVAGVFYFGGWDFFRTLAGKGNMSKGRCAVLVVGLALGALFFTGGIFDTIGLTDRVIVTAIESLLNN